MTKKKRLLRIIESIENNFDNNMKDELVKIYTGQVPEVLEDDFETVVDKETWNDVEESDENIDNSDIIEIDGEGKEESVPADEYLINRQFEVPEVLNEFNSLSDEDKKELLLRLAKKDNNLDAILNLYLNSKLNNNIEENNEKPWLSYMKPGMPESEAYAIWATEQGGND